jgi:hypothetical protein
MRPNPPGVYNYSRSNLSFTSTFALGGDGVVAQAL